MLPLNMLMEMYKEKLRKRLPREGSYPTTIKGLEIHRRDRPTPPKTCFIKPKIIVIVQACKHAIVGSQDYYCREGNLLLASVNLPNTSSIIEIEPGKPGMSMTLEVDKSLLAQLTLELPPQSPFDTTLESGIMIQPVDPPMLEAFLKLDELIDQPEHIAVLAPLIIKEIHYRLLAGPHGRQLRAFHTYGTQKSQIMTAISWLNENFSRPLNVESLAAMVHMASCTFHRHFKDVTTLTPLQYQKRLRLHEAQRLMIIDNVDVSNACDSVGYESLPQFTREYKRFFGEPPRRNVTRWQREHVAELSLLLDD
jgi:AraC-like DNA-binding protein